MPLSRNLALFGADFFHFWIGHILGLSGVLLGVNVGHTWDTPREQAPDPNGSKRLVLWELSSRRRPSRSHPTPSRSLALCSLSRPPPSFTTPPPLTLPPAPPCVLRCHRVACASCVPQPPNTSCVPSPPRPPPHRVPLALPAFTPSRAPVPSPPLSRPHVGRAPSPSPCSLALCPLTSPHLLASPGPLAIPLALAVPPRCPPRVSHAPLVPSSSLSR
ncbi:hypothetical protein BOTBODRAFT_174085 [Botryobasidium botryosum FD-172 SS1]|uniref:Uncharacterized protein n=1 Tax=Botryobasidium botryosum (strain FD-172 SS1) TaxID=930990 RepID=A0A067MI58_BOTB1|nr:hypothetical protein BOTBODRAFT_174085 [Botryobasidium botryosum FD-172 SS1]